MKGITLNPAALEALVARAVVAALKSLGRGQGAKDLGELLDQPASWRYCGLSRSVWFRLRSQGKLPDPVDAHGGNPRWRRCDLEKFVKQLKPSRRSPAKIEAAREKGAKGAARANAKAKRK
jgi:predicted DNA-binding transcriptional regulator AlpA